MRNESKFKLPDSVDKNKVFLVNLSDIEGRIDPIQFSFERVKAIEILKSHRPLTKLSKVTLTKKYTVEDSDFPYVGLENIESHTGEYIFTKDKDSFGSANTFFEGDILFPKLRPYLNKVYLAEFNGVCSTEFHVLKAKSNMSSKFLTLYLRSDLIVNQTKYLMTGNTLPRLQTQDIYNLPVPILERQIQDRIANIYDELMRERRLKIRKADELLSSIDSYLLEQLGIEMPQVDNSLSSRMFTVQASDIDKTFDPAGFFNKQYNFGEGCYKNNLLSELMSIHKGKSITSDSIVEGVYPVIAGGQISPYNHNEYNCTGETLTVSASGAYSGYVWYHNTPIFASDCLILKAKSPNKYATRFIYEVLKLKQAEIYRLQRGAGQPHVYQKDLNTIKIPNPPLDKQQEIVEHIDQIRETAQQLQQEAEDILESAKKQVEDMILGRD